MTIRNFILNWLVSVLLATIAVAAAPPAATEEPPEEVYVTREAKATSKDGKVVSDFEAKIKLRHVGGGALEGKGSFHLTHRLTGEGQA